MNEGKGGGAIGSLFSDVHCRPKSFYWVEVGGGVNVIEMTISINYEF